MAIFKSVLKDLSHRPSPSLFAPAKIKTLVLHLPHHQNGKTGDEEHILYRLFYFNGGKKKDSTEKKNSIKYRIQQKVQVSNSTAISVSNCLRKCAEVKNACVTFLIATFGEN